MPVTVANLIQGPGTLYRGAFGATEPADTAVNTTPPSSSWTDLGGTQDGVKLVISHEYKELEVDQIVDIPERRLIKREPRIETNLAEATLTNLTYALNDTTGTTSSGAGFAAFDPTNTTSATQPTYGAYILDGFAPSGFRRRVFLRRALTVEGIESSYKKDDQTLFPVKFSGHYVSASVRPYRIVDQTS